VDKDGNGFVGFEEFLDLFQILSSGMVKKKQFKYVLSFKK
jgi:Ca2+-binding EF-hand superfamily protein